jgi:hypothetical protein
MVSILTEQFCLDDPPFNHENSTMKRLFGLLSFALVFVAIGAESTKVAYVIDRKPTPVPENIQNRLVEASVSLLASCGYSDTKTQTKEDFAEARKFTHIQIVFNEPRTVDLKSEKMTVQVKEMIITLPLTTGVIWVPFGERILYFSKYQPKRADELDKVLKEIPKP